MTGAEESARGRLVTTRVFAKTGTKPFAKPFAVCRLLAGRCANICRSAPELLNDEHPRPRTSTRRADPRSAARAEWRFRPRGRAWIMRLAEKLLSRAGKVPSAGADRDPPAARAITAPPKASEADAGGVLTFGDVASAREGARGSDAATEAAARWSAGAVKRVGSIKFAAPARGAPARCPGRDRRRSREARSRRAARRQARRFPRGLDLEDARQVLVDRAAAMGRRGLREAPRRATGASARSCGARARRPRSAAAIGSRRGRRDAQKKTKTTFCLRASACAALCARGRTPRTRWSPSSSPPRCAERRARRARRGSSGVWTTDGARRFSARTPRSASAIASVLRRRPRSASRSSARHL